MKAYEKDFYKIKITNWTKYNGKRKKSYRLVMISENFLDDAKVRTLTPCGRLLFLSCILGCSQSGLGEVSLSAHVMFTQSGCKPNLIPTYLDQLQSLQLLTYEKFSSLLKRNEMKGNEKKRNEDVHKHVHQEELKLQPAEPAHPSNHPFLTIWNEHRGKLPEARSCAPSRLKKIKARWPEQTPDEWVSTIKRLADSDFCCGKGSTGWRADFDFLLKPDTWTKVNEGRYDNGKGPIRTAQTAKYDNLDAIEKSWQEKEVRS